MAKKCESCGKGEATSFITYEVRGHQITVALCDKCSDAGLSERIMRMKSLHIPPVNLPKLKPKIFVVVEVEKRDDYYAHQPLKKPIAAFVREENAAAFVESKQSEGFLYLEWEIVPTPLGDVKSSESS